MSTLPPESLATAAFPPTKFLFDEFLTHFYQCDLSQILRMFDCYNDNNIQEF